MKILDWLRITGQDSTKHVIPAVTNDVQEKSIDVLGSFLQFSNSTLSNETTVSSKVLLANRGWVYRNNDAIAKEVSKMEFELYTVGISGGEIVYNEVETHPLLDLLDQWNPEITNSDGIYILQSHRKLAGDAFLLKVRKGRQIVALRSLQPDKVELMFKKGTPDNPGVLAGYHYKDSINGETIDIEYSPNDIIHFKIPNPSNPYRGLGAVEALADTIDLDNLTNETTKKFFQNGAITNFVLSTESKINDEQLKRLRAEMRADYGGASKAYKAMILGGGLKPVDISYTNKDMEFLGQLEWYRDKIMYGFGNTKASLGMVDDVNRASHQGSITEWLRNTVKPDMQSIVDTFNEFLVPEYGTNLVLGFCDPVPEDRTDDIAEVKDLYSVGVMTLNEARELIDLDPVPEGDEFKAPAPSPLIDPKQDPKEQEVPKSLRGVNIKALLRKRGIYLQKKVHKELKEAAVPIARQMINGRKKTVAPVVKQDRRYHSFTNEQAVAYWEKQIRIIDSIEKKLDLLIQQFVNRMVEDFLKNIDEEINTKSFKKLVAKDFFSDSEQELLTRAQLDFTPLLVNQAIISGQEALKLINSDNVYLAEFLRKKIAENVELFTKSMIDTDRQKMIDAIANGLADGQSVPDIRSQILKDFDDYSKMQAERITRTEVARVSNQAALDAWEESGVVEGKQWITFGASDECLNYDGQIVSLGKNFYGGTDEFKDGDPPLHPNCRCGTIPILIEEGNKVYNPIDKQLVERIKELESKIDKRTKAFKELKAQYRAEKADDAVYIKSLEKYLGVDSGTQEETDKAEE